MLDYFPKPIPSAPNSMFDAVYEVHWRPLFGKEAAKKHTTSEFPTREALIAFLQKQGAAEMIRVIHTLINHKKHLLDVTNGQTTSERIPFERQEIYRRAIARLEISLPNIEELHNLDTLTQTIRTITLPVLMNLQPGHQSATLKNFNAKIAAITLFCDGIQAVIKKHNHRNGFVPIEYNEGEI